MMEHAREGRPVLVVGSANMDLVVRSGRFPRPGETVLGDEFGMYPGGKGANQAVACARLGGRVRFIGKMGDDFFRERLTDSLRNDDVGLDAVLSDDEASTGVALIAVDGTGENQITVVAGSNMRLRADEVAAREALFEDAAVVLLQLEIPLEAVERAAELGRKHGATVILNPAPARPLPDALLAGVDLLTPNESELALLAGTDGGAADGPGDDGPGDAAAERAARRLLARGVGTVLVTLGARGALLVTPDACRRFPVPHVDVVDSTAAGDAFNGALAYALARGEALEEAVRLANAAATHVVTRRGAQTSMPTMADVRRYAAASHAR